MECRLPLCQDLYKRGAEATSLLGRTIRAARRRVSDRRTAELSQLGPADATFEHRRYSSPSDAATAQPQPLQEWTSQAKSRHASRAILSRGSGRCACSHGFKPIVSKYADCRSPADGAVHPGGAVAVEKDDQQRSDRRRSRDDCFACGWGVSESKPRIGERITPHRRGSGGWLWLPVIDGR